MAFKTDPSLYAASTVPTMEDWKGLWSVWDLVTRGMIPEAELNESSGLNELVGLQFVHFGPEAELNEAN